MAKDFELVIVLDKPVYWPCWPFKHRYIPLPIDGGFKLKVYQREVNALCDEPVVVEGYISGSDNVTVTVDFNGGSRLKRHT